MKSSITPALEALRYNQSLTALNISGNRAGDDAMIAIGRALSHNSTLTSLQIDDNRTTYIGFEALGDMLAENHTIVHFPMPIADIKVVLYSH